MIRGFRISWRQMKTCTKCSAEKPQEMFFRQASRKDGLHCWCKDCCRESNRQYLSKPENRDRRLAWRRENEPHDRATRARYLYGVSADQLAELLRSQGGGCGICGSPDPGGRWRTWHVDHDHTCCPPGRKTCGECVRGLLCQNCNILLGHAKDDPGRLKKALAYLEEKQ